MLQAMSFGLEPIVDEPTRRWLSGCVYAFARLLSGEPSGTCAQAANPTRESGRHPCSLLHLPRLIFCLRDERGLTLSELVVTMAILGIVLTGITSTLISATHHEADLNQRFQAQQSARLALSKVRDELHCASAVSPTSGATSVITLTLPSGCTTGTGSVIWCTVANGSHYDLWRIPGTSCDTAASDSVRWAQKLTTQHAFQPDATAHSGAPVLPDVGLTFTVAAGSTSYELTDTIYLRNGVRQ
jgi:prepilin-type N-terminal cleavage/methylation domain-containing protein